LLDVPQGAWGRVLCKLNRSHRSTHRIVWDLISEYESSPERRKCFCSNCGSQLFIRRLDKPEVTVVTLGTLDGDPHARPERHVFVASKAPWYEIADSLPQFKIYPRFEPTDDAFA
jgi:hypothetical protein